MTCELLGDPYTAVVSFSGLAGDFELRKLESLVGGGLVCVGVGVGGGVVVGLEHGLVLALLGSGLGG